MGNFESRVERANDKADAAKPLAPVISDFPNDVLTLVDEVSNYFGGDYEGYDQIERTVATVAPLALRLEALLEAVDRAVFPGGHADPSQLLSDIALAWREFNAPSGDLS